MVHFHFLLLKPIKLTFLLLITNGFDCFLFGFENEWVRKLVNSFHTYLFYVFVKCISFSVHTYTAMQRRDVTCQAANGSDIEVDHCNEIERPTQRQECYNDKCKGTWKVGEWSEVSDKSN